MIVLIYAVAKHLLALLVDEVNVVQDDEFLLIFNRRTRLAKRLYVVAIVIDALFFQAVNMQYIVLIQGPMPTGIIFANYGVQQGRFTGTHIADKQNV
jgi:hypothetical protein